MPPFGTPAKATTARSISAGSRALTRVVSTLSDGASAWMTPNWPIPDVVVGSRSTATRVTAGATCLSSSSHFPLMLNSNAMNPVAFPPGPGQILDETGADRIGDDHEHNRHRPRHLQQRAYRRGARG